MTQTDQNTPATATTSKRVTKPKTTAAKNAADTEVNQDKTSSQAELQEMQSDTAAQNSVSEVEPEQATAKEADATVNQDKTSSQAELHEPQSDTAAQNPVAEVEPEQTTDPEPDNSNQEISVTADTESSSPEVPSSPINESVGTEQVLPKVQSSSPIKQTTVAKSGLFVVVKNTGVQTVFEPLSKTSIKSGETVEISCSNGQFKHDVMNNLKQFIGLGKNLEIQNA